MKFGFSTLEPIDYIEAVLRRKWIVVVSLAVGIAGAGLAFLAAPRIYASSTLIMVESQKVPTNIVAPVVVDTMAQRLQTIKQQILSRTLLSSIIDDFNLYAAAMANGVPVGRLVTSMRKHIDIQTVGSRGNIQAFSIGFEGTDPETVQRVTNRLASLFMEENLKVREQLIEGTANFLHQELRRVEDDINRKEKEISDYKRQYLGSLPDQLEANLQTLDRLQSERQRLFETLLMLDERQAIVDELTAFRAREAAARAAGSVDVPIDASGDPLEVGPAAQLQQLRQLLVQLQTDYTDSYPEVMRLKRKIAELEARLSGEAVVTNGSQGEAGEKVGGEDGADVFESVVMAEVVPPNEDILALDSERRLASRRMQEIDQQIAAYERRVEQSPQHSLALANKERDYDNVLRNYHSLLDKKLAADVSENLEMRQKGERFRVVDSADLPETPIKPNPPMFFVAGTAGGLLVAIGLIAWLDFRVLPFRRPEQVEANLGLPILATVPHMTGVLGEESPNANGHFRFPRWRSKSQETAQAGLNAHGTEQLRVLAGRVIRLQHQKDLRIMAFTSATAGEGKTMLATGLAVVLARDYLEKVILVDGDMANPGVSNRLGLHSGPGLMSVLEGECDLDAALYQDVRYPNLMILAAGVNGNASLGLAARRADLERLFAELRQRRVLVIVDSPPVLAMADMHVFSEAVDGVMMVIRAGRTAQSEVVQGLKFLTEAGGNIQGTVLNDLAVLPGQEKSYGYGGKYVYGVESHRARSQVPHVATLRGDC